MFGIIKQLVAAVFKVSVVVVAAIEVAAVAVAVAV